MKAEENLFVSGMQTLSPCHKGHCLSLVLQVFHNTGFHQFFQNTLFQLWTEPVPADYVARADM